MKIVESNPEDKPDKEFERLVQEAKSGAPQRWDKGNTLLNCIAMVGTVVFAIFLAPFSFFILMFLVMPLGGVAFAFGGTVENKQVGGSLFIGCLLSVIYLGVMASQW